MNSLRLILSNKRYLSPAIVFATLNVLLGTWAIYIPHVKSKLAIDDGEFGFASIFFGLGTFIMLLIAPYLIQKIKVGRSTGFGVLLLMFSFTLPLIVNSYYELCASLFIVGFIGAFTDISMNSLVSEIEKEDGVHIMSANHGFFSLGGMLSAGIGTFFLPIVEVPVYHMLVVILILILINGFLMKNYFSHEVENVKQTKFSFSQLKPVLTLVIIGFFIMGSEGAIESWSALYLENISMTEEKFFGLGFTAFSFTMAFGRFFGDKISQQFGSKKIILIGTLVGIIGFASVLLVDLTFVIIGFALVGIGFSVIIPELYRIGGKLPNIDSSKGISMIAGAGFLGFLITPFLLGQISDWSSLKYSFVALLGFSVISFVLMLTIKNR
ncbi:MFS transporter [Urechidicola croceus]|uniref:MFS transporter n=1 Tax=Urechidicola croceus TaxID=1850246 RepID=A0A1D8P605_9FLAO|nr:MFS transporter [Urechidicola croceus]AOW20011.1 MFS transporter [Urechidicola croceus]